MITLIGPPIAIAARQHPPPQINDAHVSTYFNYGEIGHIAKRCKSIPKLVISSIAHVKLTNE